MVRTPYFDKNGVRKGAWSEEEDNKLKAYILRYGHWNWRQLPKFAGLARCGQRCRLRWMNYLKPGLKRGNFSHEEEELVIRLHNELGNKWSAIAARLPGRTDNEIKNYWHAHIKKAMKENSETTEPIAQTNETNQSGADQDEQSSEFYENEVDRKEDFPRESPVADAPSLQNSVAFPVSPYNSSTESPSICSSSPHLGGMELIEEDIITSLQSFGQPFDSFWTEPFYADTLYSERDNLGELCEEFMHPYTWYMEDVTDLWDQFM